MIQQDERIRIGFNTLLDRGYEPIKLKFKIIMSRKEVRVRGDINKLILQREKEKSERKREELNREIANLKNYLDFINKKVI